MKDIIYPTVEDLLSIHKAEIKSSEGSYGVRDFDILESAINRPRQTFDGEDLYPNLFSKAAALLESLIKNHPFIDGNKRTAATVMITFIEINGVYFNASNEELEDFIVKVATKEIDFEGICQWLYKVCENNN